MTQTAEAPTTISDLCVEVLRDCQRRLTHPDSLHDEALVHDLRVATKRLRAAWHLVGELSGKKLARKRRKTLRKLSAHLAFRRDAAVLDELVATLSESQPDPKASKLLGRIRDAIREEPTHSEEQPCPDGLFEEVCEGVTEEIAAWEAINWGAPKKARKAIRRSLRKTASRARKKTGTALKDKSPEAWHDWRKAIKRLRYQREFVAQASGRTPGKFDGRISRLGTALGQRNDLANLLHYMERKVETGEFDKPDLKKMRAIIGRAEHEIVRNCRRRGRRLIQKK